MQNGSREDAKALRGREAPQAIFLTSNKAFAAEVEALKGFADYHPSSSRLRVFARTHYWTADKAKVEQ